jgi:hypothetical protein
VSLPPNTHFSARISRNRCHTHTHTHTHTHKHTHGDV